MCTEKKYILIMAISCVLSLSIFTVLLIYFHHSTVAGKVHLKLKDTKQEWGHITVREHAHMFWWLYYTTADEFNYTERPLIIWLQGGPGMASSGYGNFVELGPLDINYNEKDYSIIQDYNVLFIDNPIGVGYSYLSDYNTKIPSNNREIGEDLVKFLQLFMDLKSEFQQVPLYIFGESYGGKMAIEFAYQLDLQQKDSITVNWNLKGIGLGNSYISPIDYIRSYAPLAFYLGLVDKQGFTRIDELAKQIEVLINKKEYEEATDVENTMTNTFVKEMPGIDVYNIILRSNLSTTPSFLDLMPKLTETMNSKVQLNLTTLPDNFKWSFLNNEVYYNLQGDLMRSVTDKVEYLLNETNIKIIVYNGLMDFLVNTAGTRMWLQNLNWNSKDKWTEGVQLPLELGGIVEGYVKEVDNLVLYTIFRAGHSVPVDNLPAFREMLRIELLENMT